jgi:hypothetical protein
MDPNHPVVQQTKRTSPGKADLIVRRVETTIHVPPPKRLNMLSFIDHLDIAIGNYDPYTQTSEGRIPPPLESLMHHMAWTVLRTSLAMTTQLRQRLD